MEYQVLQRYSSMGDSFNATGMVNVSVYNISSGNGSACSESSARCVPFSVFYTLDGSIPTKYSTPACATDVCTSQPTYSILIQGAVHLRALALRQGSHPDACVAFGDNVSMYQLAPGAYPASHIAGMPARGLSLCSTGFSFLSLQIVLLVRVSSDVVFHALVPHETHTHTHTNINTHTRTNTTHTGPGSPFSASVECNVAVESSR
jgi:hypothetical protein